ncbi:MAG: hypothetical protein DRN12_00810 [Thermoplasmata archaeon]|nr:MAG: hypothetical protein DRN12_00810 [Thermoplasmata archaeon]
MYIRLTAIFITLSLIIPSSFIASSTPVEKPKTGEFTFIMGTLFKPVETNTTVTGKAIELFYYKPSPFIDEFGVVSGFKTVKFDKGLFVFLYRPGPFGLIGYVFGFCRGFEILDEGSIPGI